MPVFVGAGTSSFMKGSGGVGMSTATTTTRNALSGVRPGQMIFNHTTSLMEYYNGSAWIAIDTPPTVTSVNNTNISATQIAAGFDLVITGTFFASGATIQFIGNDGTSHTSPTVAVNSTTQITARVHSSVSNSNEPYDIKVTNPSGLASTLEDAFNVNAAPVWTTNAGNLATIADNATGTHATVAATDPESDTVTYSGTVGGGMSINSTTGNITGDPTDVSSNTTVSFTLNATSSGINTTSRNFNIIVTPQLGGQHNPASSAKAIYDTGNRTNGVYYLNHGSGAYQTYCWIDANSGGGYHLVAKIDNSSPSVWHYGGSRWDTSSEQNASNCQNLNNNEGVNRGYYQYTLQTGFRMGLHVPTPSVVSNYLTEAKTGNTAKHFFTTANGSSQNNRTGFKAWIVGAGSGFDNGFTSNYDTHQPNCNQYGFYHTTPTSQHRWGTAGNNENDCNSNDSSIGFGCAHGSYPNAAGGRSTHALNTTRYAIGYIFVQ